MQGLDPRAQFKFLQAKYDAAQTVTYNQEHWANADHLDPHTANRASVRRELRSRSRYEAGENNAFLKGMVLTLANDTVGRGPVLQVIDQRLTRQRRRHIEDRFRAWSKAIRLRDKLWRLRYAKCVDGEGFAVAVTNRRLNHPVTLDYRIFEADQIASPFEPALENRREVDGVRFDANEVPEAYHVLTDHPGAGLFFRRFNVEGRWVDADLVLHWFRQERGWLRGIPETTPSLPACAVLRRYTDAVLASAEIGASYSAVLESDGPPATDPWTDGEGNVQSPIFDTHPIEKGMMVVMPYTYRLNQLKPEQPTGMYDSFVQSVLLQIARPLMMPHNRAIASSKDSNMASAVVDEHLYRSGIKQERVHCEDNVLEGMLRSWWQEGLLTEGYFDAPVIGDRGSDLRRRSISLTDELPKHVWRWDQIGIDHTDPQKVEGAWVDRWNAGFATDRDVQEQRFNRDVDEWADDMQEDIARRETLGLPPRGGFQHEESVSEVDPVAGDSN